MNLRTFISYPGSVVLGAVLLCIVFLILWFHQRRKFFQFESNQLLTTNFTEAYLSFLNAFELQSVYENTMTVVFWKRALLRKYRLLTEQCYQRVLTELERQHYPIDSWYLYRQTHDVIHEQWTRVASHNMRSNSNTRNMTLLNPKIQKIEGIIIMTYFKLFKEAAEKVFKKEGFIRLSLFLFGDREQQIILFKEYDHLYRTMPSMRRDILEELSPKIKHAIKNSMHTLRAKVISPLDQYEGLQKIRLTEILDDRSAFKSEIVQLEKEMDTALEAHLATETDPIKYKKYLDLIKDKKVSERLLARMKIAP